MAFNMVKRSPSEHRDGVLLQAVSAALKGAGPPIMRRLPDLRPLSLFMGATPTSAAIFLRSSGPPGPLTPIELNGR